MKKYRVSTEKLIIPVGAEIIPSEDIIGDGIFSNLKENKIEANPNYLKHHPEWFQPVEEEWEKGGYWKKTGSGLYRIQCVTDEGCLLYNIYDDYEYSQLDTFSHLKECGRKATSGEIETALIAEAKRRGFPTDTWSHPNYSWNFIATQIGDWEYDKDSDALYLNCGVVYEKGIFGTPIDIPQCTKITHRYSGAKSRTFWQMVNSAKNKEELYSLGVALQNLEEFVLKRMKDENPNFVKDYKL